MPSPFVFLIVLLATYRLSHMIAMEDGPFDMFATARDAIGQASWVGRGFHCALCLSFWLSLPMAWVIVSDFDALAFTWLGIAGACLVLHRALYGGA
jgi:hypothetical protein